MDINKHPLYRAIYELGLAIEDIPASDQQTKISIMCSNLAQPADLLFSQWQRAEMKCDLGVTLERLGKLFNAEAVKMKGPPLIELNWEQQETAAAVVAGIGRCLEMFVRTAP